MELSTEDKERIYKEVNRIFNESESVDLVHELMFKVGEYEHNYQREQQKNLSDKRKLWDDENNNLIKELGRRDGKIQKLEAERSDLRDKVIEECIERLTENKMHYVYMEGEDIATRVNELDQAIYSLNSLKTK